MHKQELHGVRPGIVCSEQFPPTSQDGCLFPSLKKVCMALNPPPRAVDRNEMGSSSTGLIGDVHDEGYG